MGDAAAPTRLVYCFLGLLCILGSGGSAIAQIDISRLQQVILIDHDTGTILLEKNADAALVPASMTKIMTAAVIFAALRSGEISLQTKFPTSEYAWRKGGAPSRTSSMFAALGSAISVENLLKGLVIQSGNDSAIILAEGLDGSVQEFAKRMTSYGRKIGLQSSRFVNPHGLPESGHVTTVRDMAHLARHLIDTYPEEFGLFAEREFTWNKIRQTNRNRLLGEELGVDGLKTGYSQEFGFVITLSAKQNGRRLILVIGGAETANIRVSEGRRILRWGFESFDRVTLFEAGETISHARVYGGEQRTVPLVGRNGMAVSLLLPSGLRQPIKARIYYTGPISAPVARGQAIGMLKIWHGEHLAQQTAVYAARAVRRGSMFRLAADAVQQLTFGWW